MPKHGIFQFWHGLPTVPEHWILSGFSPFDHVQRTFDVGLHFARTRRSSSIRQDGDRLRIGENVVDLFVGKRGINAGISGTDLQDRELGKVKVFGFARQQNRDHAFVRHEVTQELGESVGLAVELRIRDRAPFRPIGAGRGIDRNTIRPAPGGIFKELVEQ